MGARSTDVVIFIRNTTDALSLLATAAPGLVVYLDVEPHANLLPWQRRRGWAVTAPEPARPCDASFPSAGGLPAGEGGASDLRSGSGLVSSPGQPGPRGS